MVSNMEIEQADQLDELKEAMVNFICQDKEANLQNIQQINDIETFKERKKIIEDALELNHISFLSRFRKSLKPNHLKFFELQTYPPEMQFDINFYLKEITLEFKNRDTIIKNRRFGALTKLIEDKKYFSVDEMKLRNPLLYNQLVDRYLSADERRAYNRPNPRTDTLTDILLKGIDRDYMQDLEKKQIEEEGSDSEDSSNDSESREQFPKQWGNFEENSNPIDQPSTSHPRKRIKKTKAITSEERSLLKDEFLGIMYASFLEGKDDFDYSTVDNNAAYDDLIEKDQDIEDKYFDDNNSSTSNEAMASLDDDSLPDALDLYMKEVDKELQLKKKIDEFQEENESD